MDGRVLAALLGLCVGLMARAQDAENKDPSHPDFDLVKFSGLWYEVATASKLSYQIIMGNRLKKVGAVLVQLKGTTLALTSAFDNLKQCVKEVEQASQGDVPWQFKVSQESGSREVRVLSTDYKTYAIMDVTLHQGGTTQRVMTLYSRSLHSNEEAMKKFREVAVENGFLEKDVYALDQDLTCVKLLSS